VRFEDGRAVFDVHDRTGLEQWRQLADEFFQHLAHPELAHLVITDRYERVVNEWQRQTPSEFGGQGAGVYVANKIDGTRAGAKTVVLAGRRSVVVASAGTRRLGTDVARWMLTHEAQHVRLHERDLTAWAVQRRLGRGIVPVRPWEFVYCAQNALDEYRCERAVHSKLPAIQRTYDPHDFQAVMRKLGDARAAWRLRGDLVKAHQIVTQVIDRLAVIAAYSAAAIDAGHDTAQRWSSASKLGPIWGCLRRAPGVDETASKDVLWGLAVETSGKIDQLLRHDGIELTFTDDDGLALYFS
jgi:hypothetical protein